MRKLPLLLAALAVLSISSVVSASTVWSGASFTVTPSSISSGGTVTITLSSSTSSTPVVSYCQNGGGSGNSGPLQYYTVSEITVTDPNGVVYRVANLASPQLTVAPSDSLGISFGPGIGAITVVSGTFGSEGPYYWHSAGHTLNPTTSAVTTPEGTYRVDIAGNNHCGTSSEAVTTVRFFDIRHTFTVPEFGPAAIAVVSISLMGLMLIRKKSNLAV